MTPFYNNKIVINWLCVCRTFLFRPSLLYSSAKKHKRDLTDMWTCLWISVAFQGEPKIFIRNGGHCSSEIAGLTLRRV